MDLDSKGKKLWAVDPPGLRLLNQDAQRQAAEDQRQEERRKRLEQEYLAAQETRRRIREREDMHAYSPEYFMKSGDSFLFDPRGRISSRELYDLYCRWCESKALLPHPQRAFLLYVSRHSARYKLLHSSNIPLPGGGHVNGYLGIRRMTEEERNAKG